MNLISHSIKKTRVLVDYRLESIGTDENEDLINLINNGYELYGSPFYWGNDRQMLQAIIKYEDKIETTIDESIDENEIPN